MAYVVVKEDTEDKLHLARDPGLKAWAIFFGLIALGLGAAFYSNDYLLWKIAYISGSVFVGLNCMEDWEECILDKKTRQVKVMRQSLVQRMFQTMEGAKVVSGSLDEVVRVSVESEEVRYVGNGYMVVMHFAPGFSIGVTETATVGEKTEHELIAEKIHKFLDLDNKAAEDIGEEAEKSAEVASADKDTSTDDDDSFEQIDKEDLMDIPEGVPGPPPESPPQEEDKDKGLCEDNEENIVNTDEKED